MGAGGAPASVRGAVGRGAGGGGGVGVGVGGADAGRGSTGRDAVWDRPGIGRRSVRASRTVVGVAVPPDGQRGQLVADLAPSSAGRGVGGEHRP